MAAAAASWIVGAERRRVVWGSARWITLYCLISIHVSASETMGSTHVQL